MSKGKKNKKGNLAGVAHEGAKGYLDTAKEGGLLLVTAIAAGAVGAAIGKHSLLAGLPVALIGVHKKNHYILAAGLGLSMANGFQTKSQNQGTTAEGIDGLKEIAQQAKDRVGTFFDNFKEKLYLAPALPKTTEGLGEEEQVTYFINPYKGAGEIDMTAIDKVQEQIAEMSKNTNGLNEVEKEF